MFQDPADIRPAIDRTTADILRTYRAVSMTGQTASDAVKLVKSFLHYFARGYRSTQGSIHTSISLISIQRVDRGEGNIPVAGGYLNKSDNVRSIGNLLHKGISTLHPDNLEELITAGQVLHDRYRASIRYLRRVVFYGCPFWYPHQMVRLVNKVVTHYCGDSDGPDYASKRYVYEKFASTFLGGWWSARRWIMILMPTFTPGESIEGFGMPQVLELYNNNPNGVELIPYELPDYEEDDPEDILHIQSQDGLPRAAVPPARRPRSAARNKASSPTLGQRLVGDLSDDRVREIFLD